MRLAAGTVLLLALLAAPAGAGIVELTCDEAARKAGWCYSDQDGQTITVLGVAVTGPAQAQCSQKQAAEPDCQAARVVAALSRGWKPAMECTESLVDAGVCHRSYLGRMIGNPLSQKQFADRELRALIWRITSEDWRRVEAEQIKAPPPLLMDGKEPP